jgi:multidrug efflux pump subunit AcrA (membrane-fusion protein)
MSRKEALELRGAQYDAGLAQARAQLAVDQARDSLSKAKAELDRANIEYGTATRKATEFETASIESAAKGAPVKGLELIADEPRREV